MAQGILVINSGSTSVKFADYRHDGGANLNVAARGQVEGIGSQPHFVAKGADGKPIDAHEWEADHPLTQDGALRFILGWLKSHINDIGFAAAGHRLVLGGTRHADPVLVDEAILAELDSLCKVEPSHPPFEIAGIRAVAKAEPNMPQVACFDTSFHRRIFERMMSYTLYRIAMTLDIMVFIVLATIVYGFFPLTAAMLIMLALLDDIPIMTIAFDNANVPLRPTRWQMDRVLVISSVLGALAVMQSFGLLYVGQTILHLDASHLQTLLFLQLVVGGHLMLFVTRSKEPFWRPLFPGPTLFWAIVATQVIAALLCGFGLLVPRLSWPLIGLVWAYNLTWMFVQDAVKLAIYGELEQRARHAAPWLSKLKALLHPDHAMTAAAAGARVRPPAETVAQRLGAHWAHNVTLILGISAAALLVGSAWRFAPQAGPGVAVQPATPLSVVPAVEKAPAGAPAAVVPETPAKSSEPMQLPSPMSESPPTAENPPASLPPATEELAAPPPVTEEAAPATGDVVQPKPETAVVPSTTSVQLATVASEAQAMAKCLRLQKQLPDGRFHRPEWRRDSVPGG